MLFLQRKQKIFRNELWGFYTKVTTHHMKIYYWNLVFHQWTYVKRLRTLCVEIFKTLNNLNSSFMKEIFSLGQTERPVWEKHKLNLDIPSYNQVTIGRKTFTFFGPKTWNTVLYHIKSAESLASFKTMFWNGKTYSRKICCKKKINYFPNKASWKFLFRNSGLSNDSRFCWSWCEIGY